MATFTQLPGQLDVNWVSGDELRIDCDFDVSIVGYTVTNSVYLSSINAATGGGGGSVTTIGSTVTTFDQTVTSAANGQVRLTLPEEKSALLTPGKSYRWYLRWIDTTGATRTVLSGNMTPSAP